jgi:predicted lipoprotein
MVTLVLGLAVAGCSNPSGDDDDPRERLIKSWWSGFLSVELDDLIAQSEGLQQASADLCDAPSQQALDDARGAWTATHRALKRQEIFNFGPYADEPLRYSAKLDFWPARPASVEEVAAAQDIDPTVESIGGLGGPTKGLPAAQVLLWGEDPSAALEMLESSERRCEYLKAMTAVVASDANGLRQAWNPREDGYYQQLLNPGDDSDYETSILAVSAIINRLWFTVENIRMEKLGKALGTTSGGTAQPELAESRFAERSLDSIRDNLDAIELLYFGDAERPLVGVAEFVETVDPDLNDQVRADLKASRAALDAIDGPLTQAVESDAADVQAAIDELQNLQRSIEVDVMSTLGLSVSFNDNDGD